ncbi:hypothetical protein SAMN02927924_02783 [Sphingobium faniae]|nr:hypothetical protein SAMN02927924_02783 [Sphingobium faniae]
MISAFTPVGTKIVALRSGHGVESGKQYTVRGFVVNRHFRTREPDPHVLLEEILHPVGWPAGRFGEIGFPRDVFNYPALFKPERHLEAV